MTVRDLDTIGVGDKCLPILGRGDLPARPGGLGALFLLFVGVLFFVFFLLLLIAFLVLAIFI